MEFVYMRAKKNTRYTTAGITYDLDIWYENGVMHVAFTDRLGEYQVLKYHTRNEFDEEWEEL